MLDDRGFGVRLDAHDRADRKLHLAWDGAAFVPTELTEDRMMWLIRAAETSSETIQYLGRHAST